MMAAAPVGVAILFMVVQLFRKDEVVVPRCFRSDPGPQQRADNRCAACRFKRTCL